MPTADASACLAAALLFAGSVAAQATPETPGPAGAEAAVTAFTEAAVWLDWSTVGRLLDPDVLARLDAETRAFVSMDNDGWSDADDLWSDPESPLPDSLRAVVAARAAAWAHRLLGDGDGPADPAVVFARVLTPLNEAFRENVFGEFSAAGLADAVFDGRAVAASDSLVRVAGRLSLPGDPEPSELFETTARWTGDRWAVVLGRWDEDVNPVVGEVRSLVYGWEVWLAYAAQIELFQGIDPALLK